VPFPIPNPSQLSDVFSLADVDGSGDLDLKEAAAGLRLLNIRSAAFGVSSKSVQVHKWMHA
jgi:hypothetical protein